MKRSRFIAYMDMGQRHVFLLPVGLDAPRGLGSKIKQGANGPACTLARAQLQPEWQLCRKPGRQMLRPVHPLRADGVSISARGSANMKVVRRGLSGATKSRAPYAPRVTCR